MRVRKSSILIGLICLGLLIYYKINQGGNELDLTPEAIATESVNERIAKLEDEMDQNLSMMGSIKDKIDLLMDLQSVPVGGGGDDHHIAPPSPNKPVIQAPINLDGQKCPAVVPYGRSNAKFTMGDFYEKWDFVDVDGGVWKQGWEITTNDGEWKETKLKVILMPHSHNDPGWVKTLDTYYQGQTRRILNTVVDALMINEKRKFVWAETIFLDMWFNDEEVTDERKANLRKLIKQDQFEILTGGWVMTEEAPTHYFAMIDQLVEGHRWLDTNLDGYRPRNGYNCDTFGATPTTAYLNQLAGLKHMLIQRTHYQVKKNFAKDHLLEFNWRQNYDDSGENDILTHMMPFYSYDVPHTCGPEPAVCCQFDFRRLRGQSPPIACPWRIAPVEITRSNVAERARTLLDQYRKKAKLFRKGTNEAVHVVLTLLGDDFRMDSDNEARAQFENYERLFDYINSQPSLNAEVAFGTLGDYFKLVEDATPVDQFPSIEGDFFSYADRTDNYWTGFFNSRPFYKWFDRWLEHWIQATDTLFSLARLHGNLDHNASRDLYIGIQAASRTLDLFQHHDAITGTEKDFVVRDYGDRLTKASQLIQTQFSRIMEKTLGVESITLPQEAPRERGHLPKRKKIDLGASGGERCRLVSVFNSLLHKHDEIVKLRVTGAKYYTVEYSEQLSGHAAAPAAQVLPVANFNTAEPLAKGVDDSSVELALGMSVDGLSTRTIRVCGVDNVEDNGNAIVADMSEVSLYNGASADNLEPFNPEVITAASGDIITLDAVDSVIAKLDASSGLLVALQTEDFSGDNKMKLEFVQYNTRRRGDKSGAYLFMPEGPATGFFGHGEKMPFRIVRGKLCSYVHVLHDRVQHILQVNSLETTRQAVDIVNYFNVKGLSNVELIMRVNSDVESGREFYTDLNGINHARRVYYEKLTLQGNVYPIVTSSFVQDGAKRVTLLTRQASGVSSLTSGQMDVWLDRTLAQDDARGLGQPVVDNVPTVAEFKLVLEKKISAGDAQSIYLTPYCNRLSEYEHSPFVPFILSEAPMAEITGVLKPIPYDAKLVNMRPFMDKSGTIKTSVILRRYGCDCSYSDNQNIVDTKVNWPMTTDALGLTEVDETSLNALDILSADVKEITIEPIKIKTFTTK